MADLDDFFAKKDRKKAKGKKYVTTDDLAKRLEESGRKSEKSKDKKLSQNADAGDERRPEQKDEEEWKEFEEEQKDYSNLKIQNLCINEGVSGEDGQNDDENGDGELEENEVGEMVPKKKVPTGPWKVIAPVEVEPEPVRQVKPTETFGSGGGCIEKGSYIPPALRNSSANLYQPGSRVKTKQAPDINNEAFFPTLNAAKNPQPEASAWSRRVDNRKREEDVGFEEVRTNRSHNRYEPPKISSGSQGPKLALGNKFNVLRQDQS